MSIISDTEAEQRLQDLNDAKIQEYTSAIVYVAIVVLLGVCGNIMTVTFYGFKSPRTPTNVIITGLGIVDLLCCVVLSDEIIELCFTVSFKSVAGCRAMYFFNHFLVFVAGTTLLFVGIDRYRKICQPFGWQFNIFRIKLAFVAIVTYSLVTSIRDWIVLDVVHVNVTVDGEDEPVEAFYCTHSDRDDLQTTITVFTLLDLATFIVVIGGSAVLYTLIAIRLWKSRKRAHGDGKREDSSVEIQNEQTFTSVADSNTSDENTDLEKSASANGPENNEIVAGELNEKKSEAENSKESSVIYNNENVDNSVEKCVFDDDSQGDKNIILEFRKETETVDDVGENQNKAKTSPSKKKGLEIRLNTLKKKVMKATFSSEMQVEKKVTLMMTVITILSMISFVPYFVVNLGIKPNSDTSDQEFSVGIQIALRSYILNNAVNPYVIGMFNSKFRKFVKDLFCGRICGR